MFAYHCVLGPGTLQSRSWCGRALPSKDLSRHPGFAGEQPNLTLEAGVVRLDSTESAHSLATNPHYARWGSPPPRIEFGVGSSLEAVAEEGDLVSVYRFGTADLAATLMRNGRLIVALGSVAGLPLGSEISLTEDPRAAEQDLYYLTAWLARASSKLIWIDPEIDDVSAKLASIERAQKLSLVVAVRASSSVASELNRQIFSVRSGAASLIYQQVDVRFPNQEAWLAYLADLPKSRPTDLHVAVTIGHERSIVCEGQVISLNGFHVFVKGVFNPGIPGQFSQMGLAAHRDWLTPEMLLESTQSISSGARWSER